MKIIFKIALILLLPLLFVLSCRKKNNAVRYQCACMLVGPSVVEWNLYDVFAETKEDADRQCALKERDYEGCSIQ